jgi:serine protease Do
MQTLTPALAKAVGRLNTEGVIVDEVEPNSPAAHANLQQGDIVTGFDDTAIKNPQDLALAVANAKEGTAAKLTIWRDGHEQTVDVVIGQQKSAETASAQDQSSKAAPVGMALAPLTPEIRNELGLGSSAKGAYVAEVTPGSRADESGVRSGDVIVRTGNEAVTTPAEASTTIQAAEKQKKEAIPLLVMRDGTTYYLALQLMAG